MVSVCMITYKHSLYIVEAIEGVLMQKTNFEYILILVDDCSPDTTPDLIQELIHNHPKGYRIKYYRHEKNLGMMSNLLFSLQKCTNKYIAFCEGDDYWTDPLKLQKQVDFLEANILYAGCFHDTAVLYETKPQFGLKPWREYKKDIFTLEDTISIFALFHTSSFLFRNELLDLPEWFSKVQSGDMALFSLIANKGLLYRINAQMSVYRKNEGGVTHNLNFINYHRNRITLFQYLKTSCNPSVKSKISSIIKYHKKELSKYNIHLFRRFLNKFLRKK